MTTLTLPEEIWTEIVGRLSNRERFLAFAPVSRDFRHMAHSLPLAVLDLSGEEGSLFSRGFTEDLSNIRDEEEEYYDESPSYPTHEEAEAFLAGFALFSRLRCDRVLGLKLSGNLSGIGLDVLLTKFPNINTLIMDSLVVQNDGVAPQFAVEKSYDLSKMQRFSGSVYFDNPVQIKFKNVINLDFSLGTEFTAPNGAFIVQSRSDNFLPLISGLNPLLLNHLSIDIRMDLAPFIHLKTLRLKFPRSNDMAILEDFKQFHSSVLEKLDLQFLPVMPDINRFADSLTKLKLLYINDISRSKVERLTKLRSLSLDCIKTSSFEPFVGLTNVTSLDIRATDGLYGNKLFQPYKSITVLENLESFSWSGEATDYDLLLSTILKLQRLRSLSLSIYFSVATEVELTSFFTNLNALSIELLSFSNIQYPALLQTMANLRRLKTLSFGWRPGSRSSVSEIWMNPFGFFRTGPSLESLSIVNASLTAIKPKVTAGDILGCIESSSRLTNIRVTGVVVDKDDVQQLKRQRPNLESIKFFKDSYPY